MGSSKYLLLWQKNKVNVFLPWKHVIINVFHTNNYFLFLKKIIINCRFMLNMNVIA